MEKKKVLLVDDDAVFVDAVSAVFETSFRVETASNGTEALEKIRNEPPDIVVLDVMMDHLSEGFDVARKLKGDPKTKDIPVVMLTGVDEVYDYRMEVDTSYVPNDRFLQKPVEPEKLLEVIEELIGSD